MTRRARPPLRIILLSATLVLGVVAKFADSHPRLFGWPGAFILSDWTPGPLRVRALQSFGDALSKEDVLFIKRMLRSEDPRIRRRGIAFIDRFKSMDEFFELERLTRDPDLEVRAAAYMRLPYPDDRSLAIDVLMPGLRDDSDKVVAVAAEGLSRLRAKRALPELIDYLAARRATGTFTHADVVVGNAASGLAGRKFEFKDSVLALCGTPWISMDLNRPFLRAVSATRTFGRELRGDWDDDPGVAPQALELVEPMLIADNFAERDKLLAWWSKQPHRGQASGR